MIVNHFSMYTYSTSHCNTLNTYNFHFTLINLEKIVVEVAVVEVAIGNKS